MSTSDLERKLKDFFDGSVLGTAVTWRSIHHWDWDALDAAQEQFKLDNPPVPYRPEYAAPGWPKASDFPLDPPKVTEHVVYAGGDDDPDRDGDTEEIGFEDFRYKLESSGEYGMDIEGIGTAYLLDSYGGEGDGDQYWYVFKLVPESLNALGEGTRQARHFKVSGYYASYDGGYYDELFEVFPKQIQVTEWTKAEESK